MVARTFVKTGIALSLLTVATAQPATVEVISILRGTMVVQREGRDEVHIVGTRGFRLDAFLGTGFFVPEHECLIGAECAPGETIELNGIWVGGDVSGTARLRGKTYPEVGSLASQNSAQLEVSGQFTLPAMSGEPVSFTVPFDFAGIFTYAPDQSTEAQQALLTAGGTVTLTFEPNLLGDAWVFQRAEFEFRRGTR